MANTLIGCGGTGAHVALAFMRLHTLGDPLGFFRHGRKPMDLPALYLVDQDSGDGADSDKPTAWQALRRVLERHPSRAVGGDTDTGRRWPTPRAVTPLPVGASKDFLAEGMTSLRQRYPNSNYLDCILSPGQRAIEFSRGMMGSPAVGSLLFKLKSYDTRPDDPDINHDEFYHQLLNVKGRVVVVGSGVGGTGAAVGPTLAEELSGVDERQVMAVMLLNWFEFDELHEHLGENRLRAQRRNKVMQENAHSGLRYYGNRLAKHAATVPVGIPKTAMAPRLFTGDNHQPMREAYPHALAAICCLRQFLSADAYSNGLYHLDAEDPSRLGSGTGLPGGGTIGDLAARGKTLVDTLETYERVLGSSDSYYLKPILYELLGDRRQETAKELGKLRDRYSENLEWLGGMLNGKSPEPVRGSFIRETAIRERLKKDHPLELSRVDSPDQAASEIFSWLAAWVNEKAPTSTPAGPNGVYWPEMRDDQGLTPSPQESGALRKVPKSNVRATLDSFVDPNLMVQNGWPNPLATADYFREAMASDRSTAIRQLELLFLGLLVGELKLRKNERRDNRPVSLDELVDDRRTGDGNDLARYALERTGRAGVVMGFTAPRTLFCPVPGLSDPEWSGLWNSVTGQRSADWKAPGQSWGSATSYVGRIRAWIEACKRRHPHATPPPWTRIFDTTPPEGGYGGGTQLQVRWSGDELIDVFLPTRDEGGLPPEVKNLDHADPDDFLREHAEVTESGKPKFWRVEFEIAGQGKVYGIWEDHLRHLQKVGKIAFFDDDAARREVYALTWKRAHGYRLVTLPGTLVLRRGDIGIRSCTPIEQRFVPNGDTSRGVLYPHYPVRWRYFDLLMPRGDRNGKESVLDVLKRGDAPAEPREPEIDDSGQATWRLRMRGLGDPVPFVAMLEVGHKAHWMVWPRFHARDWRAYYVYQHCTDRRIRIDALWLNNQESGVVLSRTKAEDNRSYPVWFSKQEARHAAGPPVALCASKGDDEIGMYLVRLYPVQSAVVPMQIGIDFGTSHTTAAIKLGNRDAQSVDLSPELSRDGKHRLSLHVSEDLEHIEAEHGLLSQGTWFPRYVKKSTGDLQGLWPSEILTIEKVRTLSNQKPMILDWQPVRDYVIPPAGVLRRDLADHMIANFKWNTSMEFQGRESDLRKIYLDRIVEQVLAEAFTRHGRPTGTEKIQFTFTYPLRTPPRDVKEYRRTLDRVLDDGSTSLGCPLVLHDGVGLFDESHATKVGTDRRGDVNMVGDLGGGTLDLIISAVGERFEDTADSVKLGGNVLLKLIADRDGMLPADWGHDAEARLANLAAWVRTKGLTGLFGLEAERVDGCSELDVRGFDDSTGPEKGRRIVRRYFFLVGEFMARSLTAYLATHWLPKVADRDRHRLRIRVYLRGNGWKLWHEDKGYGEIGNVVQKRTMKAARRLWAALETAAAPPGSDNWRADHHEADQANRAKRDVVNEVVGQSRGPESIRHKWFSHTLVELTKVEGEGRRETVEWSERIPFRTGGEGTRIEFAEIRPGLPLSSLKATKPEVVTRLPVDLTRRINENLRVRVKGGKGELVGDAQEDYQAPVAAWVWEAVLERRVADPVGTE